MTLIKERTQFLIYSLLPTAILFLISRKGVVIVFIVWSIVLAILRETIFLDYQREFVVLAIVTDTTIFIVSLIYTLVQKLNEEKAEKERKAQNEENITIEMEDDRDDELATRGKVLLPKQTPFKAIDTPFNEIKAENQAAIDRFPSATSVRNLPELLDELLWFLTQNSYRRWIYGGMGVNNELNYVFVQQFVNHMSPQLRRAYFTFDKPMSVARLLGAIDKAMEENDLKKLRN